MRTFLDKDFLLTTDTSRRLFYEYAEKLPIIDYHCHVQPKEIAGNRRFSNITELWLGGDHYKWRAMRSCGVNEKFITGDAEPYDKFLAYARCLPHLIGNPLYHWTHLELQRYFGCDTILNEKTAPYIWKLTGEKLTEDSMSVRGLIARSNVETICTTDDPADTLEYHKTIAEDQYFRTAVYPAFRPDRAFNVERPGVTDYYEKLGKAAGIDIKDMETLKEALKRRIDFFDTMGCRVSDHALDDFDQCILPDSNKADRIIKEAIETDGRAATHEESCMIKAEILSFLAEEYCVRGWVMQIHTGVYRNANSRKFTEMGIDSGYDCIGSTYISALCRLLDVIDRRDKLPRTILYSIDPNCDAAIGTLIGAFQTSSDGYPRVMQGAAWWFNDTLQGIRQQMTSLAGVSVLGKFTGMLTDSRSFTSYSRHEYFRRILCGLIGEWVEAGLYPDDSEELEKLVKNVSYYNTKNYFGF